MSDGLVVIDFERLVRETDAAWFLLLDASDPFNPKKEWFPKSICEFDGKRNEIEVPEWLALEKDLI